MNTSKSSRKRNAVHLLESTALHRSLHHPAILSLYSTFLASTATYHVLELCTRGTLAGFIHSRHDGRLTEPQTRGVIRSLVDALIYLRKERVIHRDIKASNVLIADDSRVVSDDNLSISLSLTSLTETSRLRSGGASSELCSDCHDILRIAELCRTVCRIMSFRVSAIDLLPERSSNGYLTAFRLIYGLSDVSCSLVYQVYRHLRYHHIPSRAWLRLTNSQADSLSEVFANVREGVYDIPEYASDEAVELIDGLLQIVRRRFRRVIPFS
jgi:serine/threonine protein kinase